MIKKLIKLANQLDQKGLYKEADIIDAIVKYAIDMSPQEYERYYGKPMSKERHDIWPNKELEKKLKEPSEIQGQGGAGSSFQQPLDEMIKELKHIMFDLAEKNSGRVERLQLSHNPNIGLYRIVFDDEQDYDRFFIQTNREFPGNNLSNPSGKFAIDFGDGIYFELSKYKTNIIYAEVGLGRDHKLAYEAYYTKIV